MSKSGLKQMLTGRLAAVEERLQAACRRSGRQRSEITLVAITKTISPYTAALLPDLGVFDLGENRPQELWLKTGVLPPAVRWHMVGHLQRNKVERTLPLVRMIHSVDSVRLLQALEQEAVKQARVVEVLLEVNASREASKHGFAPADLTAVAPEMPSLKHVRVRGLMTMAAPEDDPEHCRPTFIELRQLRDKLAKELAPPHELTHLSMGMSNDFEIAIEEGATLVRLGTVLFEGLQ
jgi:pyridoxal phosphate enzyme (YggS family)